MQLPLDIEMHMDTSNGGESFPPETDGRYRPNVSAVASYAMVFKVQEATGRQAPGQWGK